MRKVLYSMFQKHCHCEPFDITQGKQYEVKCGNLQSDAIDSSVTRSSFFGMTRERGFTLVELLVVIAITTVMIAVGTNIFIGVLRSSNKASIISQVRENGDTAIETIGRYIQNASEVVEPSVVATPDIPCSSNKTYIIVKNRNNTNSQTQKLYTRFTIKAYPSGNNNGFIGIDSDDDLSKLQPNPGTFNEDAAKPITNNLGITSVNVDTTTDPVTGQSKYPYCFEIHHDTSAGITIVSPKFALSQSKSAPISRKDQSATIQFESAFTIRAY